MNRSHACLTLAAALALAACGNKGPLVLPDKPPPQGAAPATPPADPAKAPAADTVPPITPPEDAAPPSTKPAETLPLEDDE